MRVASSTVHLTRPHRLLRKPLPAPSPPPLPHSPRSPAHLCTQWALTHTPHRPVQNPVSQTLLEHETVLKCKASKLPLWPFSDSINLGEAAYEHANKFLYSNNFHTTDHIITKHSAQTGIGQETNNYTDIRCLLGQGFCEAVSTTVRPICVTVLRADNEVAFTLPEGN